MVARRVPRAVKRPGGPITCVLAIAFTPPYASAEGSGDPIVNAGRSDCVSAGGVAALWFYEAGRPSFSGPICGYGGEGRKTSRGAVTELNSSPTRGKGVLTALWIGTIPVLFIGFGSVVEREIF
jgi:hypothetical protein